MKTLHVVCGPTASGKTAFAIQLAQKLPAEIISADSRQFYKEIPIGTAAPTPQEKALVPHHLVGHLSINQSYTAAQFVHDADQIIENLFLSYNHVVVCGGSGLYLQMLLFSSDNIPAVSPEIRNKVNRIFEQEGLDALHDFLHKHDPEFLMDEQQALNPRRCIRAMEVFLESGKKMSELKSNNPIPRYNFECYYPKLPREELYIRINERTQSMLDMGWENECENLKDFQHVQALQTVGYKEIFSMMNGQLPRELLLEKIQQNTRRYAKRQDTWFRNQLLSKMDSNSLHYF